MIVIITVQILIIIIITLILFIYIAYFKNKFAKYLTGMQPGNTLHHSNHQRHPNNPPTKHVLNIYKTYTKHILNVY